jgi:hypothetical protein
MKEGSISENDFEAETLPATRSNGSVSAIPVDVCAYREQLIRKYHDGSPSLIAKLGKAGNPDYKAFVEGLIDEVIKETDNLLGNGLIATQNGELRDASVISFKRAEVLEKVIAATHAKQAATLSDGGVDVDSGAMLVIFKYFLSKAKESFDRMGMNVEINDLFFRTFMTITENWKKELRERLEESR